MEIGEERRGWGKGRDGQVFRGLAKDWGYRATHQLPGAGLA